MNPCCGRLMDEICEEILCWEASTLPQIVVQVEPAVGQGGPSCERVLGGRPMAEEVLLAVNGHISPVLPLYHSFTSPIVHQHIPGNVFCSVRPFHQINQE